MLLGCDIADWGGAAENGDADVDGSAAPGGCALAIDDEVDGSGVQVRLVVGGICATTTLPQHAHSARLSSDRSNRHRRVSR